MFERVMDMVSDESVIHLIMAAIATVLSFVTTMFVTQGYSLLHYTGPGAVVVLIYFIITALTKGDGGILAKIWVSIKTLGYTTVFYTAMLIVTALPVLYPVFFS